MRNTGLLLDDLLGKVPPKTVNLDISKLHPFEGHPYKVLDDEDMEMDERSSSRFDEEEEERTAPALPAVEEIADEDMEVDFNLDDDLDDFDMDLSDDLTAIDFDDQPEEEE